MTNWNQGQLYEKKIRDILKKRNLLPNDLQNNDAGFIHREVDYFIEIKNKDAPDFGQKQLEWSSTDGWEWSKKDDLTDLYDEIGVIDFIKEGYEPRKFTLQEQGRLGKLKKADKKFDQANFKDVEEKAKNLDDASYVYTYYAQKKCYYIQIEGKGLYFLERDEALLGVPQFVPKLSLRFRAKTVHSTPVHNYIFLVVLQAKTSHILPSAYDLEGKGNKFPPIKKSL